MNIIELTKQAEEYANNVVQSNDNDYPWGFLRYQKFAALVEAAARADERNSFYGQDKPAECAKGCPPNQICDYCQIAAPVKAMILAARADEREECIKLVHEGTGEPVQTRTLLILQKDRKRIADAITARGTT